MFKYTAGMNEFNEVWHQQFLHAIYFGYPKNSMIS